MTTEKSGKEGQGQCFVISVHLVLPKKKKVPRAPNDCAQEQKNQGACASSAHSAQLTGSMGSDSKSFHVGLLLLS